MSWIATEISKKGDLSDQDVYEITKNVVNFDEIVMIKQSHKQRTPFLRIQIHGRDGMNQFGFLKKHVDDSFWTWIGEGDDGGIHNLAVSDHSEAMMKVRRWIVDHCEDFGYRLITRPMLIKQPVEESEESE